MGCLLEIEKVFVELVESKALELNKKNAIDEIINTFNSINNFDIDKFLEISKGFVEFNGQWYMTVEKYALLLKKYDDINEIIQNESKEISIIY